MPKLPIALLACASLIALNTPVLAGEMAPLAAAKPAPKKPDAKKPDLKGKGGKGKSSCEDCGG